jgi:hypothetical protein
MRFKRSVLSLKQIISRVERDELDLQPNFQRGEVWPEPKQQRLIDSVFRGWYVPPIHVVEVNSEKREVLDGQQRLVALRDFYVGMFGVDGHIEPTEARLLAINGLPYPELPPHWRKVFDEFKVTIFTLTDYGPAEPGELFFRLNQPATLTAAEQRNAFYGKARDQVKRWVALFEQAGLNKEKIGFSNARMAYDDTLARLAFTVEHRTLATKVRAPDLVQIYRSPSGFTTSTDRCIRRAIDDFSVSASQFNPGVRFNKATLYSWLLFFVRARAAIQAPSTAALRFHVTVGEYVNFFWNSLQSVYLEDESENSLASEARDKRLLLFFENRATSRVADVSSVVIRDLILWIYFQLFLREQRTESSERLRRALMRPLRLVQSIYQDAASMSPFDEDALESTAEKRRWSEIS